MTNNGTRYAGISTSGNCAIGPVVTSPGAPEARAELRPPTLTATTKSKIPSRFQTTKTRLIAKPGRRTRAQGDPRGGHPDGDVPQAGRRYFDEFLRSPEGIATNVLSARLRAVM